MKIRNEEFKVFTSPVARLLSVPEGEIAEELELKRLHSFKNHPFLVRRDQMMNELIESIRENGILTPIIVRPKGDDYEIISGHRRCFAAGELGLTAVPAIVRLLDDDQATIAMVSANIQREKILPSELAFAFQMEQEALKHQGKKIANLKGTATVDVIGQAQGISGKKVQRYIRLTRLIPDLLSQVDADRLPLFAGVELSYLSEEHQKQLYHFLQAQGVRISVDQASRIKENEAEAFSDKEFLETLFRKKNVQKKVVLHEKELLKYFPNLAAEKDITAQILQILDEWYAGKVRQEV